MCVKGRLFGTAQLRWFPRTLARRVRYNESSLDTGSRAPASTNPPAAIEVIFALELGFCSSLCSWAFNCKLGTT